LYIGLVWRTYDLHCYKKLVKISLWKTALSRMEKPFFQRPTAFWYQEGDLFHSSIPFLNAPSNIEGRFPLAEGLG
jgi:hypothetical protein